MVINKKWKTLNSQIVFDSPWCRLRKDSVKLPSGAVMNDYFISELPSVVSVVAITPSQEIIMVQQYRYGIKKTLLELPAGTYNSVKEQPQDAIKRELLEETGYTSKKIVSLGTLYEYPTKDSHSISVYLANDVEKIQDPHLEETEDIEIVMVPIKNISQMIKDNEIQVSGTISAISMAFLHLNLGF